MKEGGQLKAMKKEKAALYTKETRIQQTKGPMEEE